MAIDDWRKLRYHHIGIPTATPRRGEVWLARYGMHVSGLDTGPFGVEWLRFEADSPLPALVRSEPHVAFVVEDLDEAVAGEEILIEANSPSPGVNVAFIKHNGAPVEFLSFDTPELEVWPGGESGLHDSAAVLRDIATAWLVGGWQEGRAAIVDELHAADFVDHDPEGRPSDNAGFSAGIVVLYAAFPDFHARIEDLIVDEAAGKVALQWTATGTHEGDFAGFDPTGQRIFFKGIEIVRIEKNRIVERWGEWNGINLLEQLGRVGGGSS